MKRLIIILTVCVPIFTYGNTNDSLEVREIQTEVSHLKTVISKLGKQYDDAIILLQQQNKKIDSLSLVQDKQAEKLDKLTDKVRTEILDANQKIDNNVNTLYDSINSRTLLGVFGILIAIIALIFIYVLRRRVSNGASTINTIRAAQEQLEIAQKSLQEESIKLDNKLVELLDKKVDTTSTKKMNEQIDHTLALKVADEIVRIELNLSRMDPSIKGYKQLSKGIERIKDNFKAKGYEIADMLNKPYNEGMRINADFALDENLEPGTRIITSITKPQVIYNGELIQKAIVTVTQNI